MISSEEFLDSSKDLPNTLQVHRANLHHMAQLLTLQDTVTATTSHPSHVEQLRTINHMVICKIGLEELLDKKSFDFEGV